MSVQENSEVKIDPAYGFDPRYLLPDQTKIAEIKHETDYIYNLKKKKKDKEARRKIYEKVEYTEFEKKGIQDLKDYIEEQNKSNKKLPQVVLPSNWSDSDWLKMCYTQRFDIKKCSEKLRDHVNWRNDPNNHKLNNTARDLLEKGFIFQFGRDKGQRPVIYLDATKIKLEDGKENIVQAISIFLGMIKKYMFVGYAVENWVVILDLKGMGLSSVPMKALGVIIGTMATNFCATLERMFILNPGGTIGWLWGTVTAFMDEETADKIQMLKPKDMAKMIDQIPNLKYLQKAHGGQYEDIQDRFFPPRDVFTDHEAIARAKKLKQEELEKQKKIKEEQEKATLAAAAAQAEQEKNRKQQQEKDQEAEAVKQQQLTDNEQQKNQQTTQAETQQEVFEVAIEKQQQEEENQQSGKQNQQQNNVSSKPEAQNNNNSNQNPVISPDIKITLVEDAFEKDFQQQQQENNNQEEETVEVVAHGGKQNKQKAVSSGFDASEQEIQGHEQTLKEKQQKDGEKEEDQKDSNNINTAMDMDQQIALYGENQQIQEGCKCCTIF